MKNWENFILMSTAIISLILFASGKVEFENMLDDINSQDTLIAMGKTIIVTIVALFTLVIMVVVFMVDIVISILLRQEFPITQYLYEKLYINFAKGWYWDSLSGSHIFLACIILFGVTLLYISLFSRGKRRPFIYHKKKY